jgi:hypothetical protein
MVVAASAQRRRLLPARSQVADRAAEVAVEAATVALLAVAAKADPADVEAVDSRVSPAVVSSHMGPLFRGPFFVQWQRSYILLYEAPE